MSNLQSNSIRKIQMLQPLKSYNQLINFLNK